MECNDDIKENYLGTGNERFRSCPRSQGATCTISKMDASGSVTFKCNNGEWAIFGELQYIYIHIYI